MNQIAEIKKRMAELETRIKETRDRLPAHSAKPGIMMELMDYEDEYEELAGKLAALKKKDSP
ncbi:MAG: hypothetical protein HUN04_10120 [Desulfobacter sp.]|nr:MAG: hypothetical protein HUN04_10120 [Desulfobacter sp.]